MKLYSYVIPRDYGFAPNPFHGVCTLATCKPKIRKAVKTNDWVIGTGSKRYDLEGKLVYAMQVSEVMTFDQYWNDPRFENKKPNLRGSLKLRLGDNIYHHAPGGKKWLQEDSHHSFENGSINMANVRTDTNHTTNVLIGHRFAYWGKDAIDIPARLRKFHKFDIVKSFSGHKCRFPDELVSEFAEWFNDLGAQGFLGSPSEFL